MTKKKQQIRGQDATVLRTARQDTHGNWRGMIQVIHNGQVIHSHLAGGRPDQTSAQRDADQYLIPWNTLEGIPASEPPPPDPEDTKEAAEMRVRYAFETHDEAEVALETARQEREDACLIANESGWTYAEIGEMVGVSHQTVSTLARRAKARTEEGDATGDANDDIESSGDT